MRVADVIFQRIAKYTDTVYHLPGGGAMFLVDALGRSGLRSVSVIHEQGAGFAALGHAMVNGFAVCLVTSGPGVTNAMTACLAAWTDSVPVLFISGQARTESMHGLNTRAKGLQYVDAVAMAEPVTKFAHEPKLAGTCIAVLDVMLQACTSGRRGACWLSVPQDVQAMEVEG